MFDHRLTDRAPGPGHDVEHAVGKAGLGHDFGEDQAGGGGELAGFRDERIAGGEDVGDALAEDQEREVPRRDQTDDADGFPRHDGELAVAEVVEAVAVKRSREAAGVFEHAHAALNLAPRLRDGFAVFERFPIGDLVDPCAQKLCRAKQHRSAVRAGEPGPAAVRESRPAGRNSGVEVGGCAFGCFGDRNAMRGRVPDQHLAVAGRHDLSVDVEPETARLFGGQQPLCRRVHDDMSSVITTRPRSRGEEYK